MCRNIRVLSNFDPPTTREEIEAAALQYVRKVSGLQKPGADGHEAFERAVAEVAASTARLLQALPPAPHGRARTREGEREKGRERWQKREASMLERLARAARRA
jgi:hypothetical protein